MFYSASMHANEWINSVVMMKFIEDYADAYRNQTEILGYNIQEVYKNSTIYIIPMVNPDGVDLVLNQIAKSSPFYKDARKIANNYPDVSFPNGWKANIRGVDLNQQFPADWEKAREVKFIQGYVSPAPRDFVGFGPLTEPESLGMYDFTINHNFRLNLAYHTQGEIIYWKYLNFNPNSAEDIARQFARISGYELMNETETNSYAGYRDWFISYYDRPGYTFETGKGMNPLSISQFDKIYHDNLGILLLASIV